MSKNGQRNRSQQFNRIVIPTGAYPDFLPRSTGQDRVCAFLFKEKRMRLDNATKVHRKSGVAKWRDQLFLFQFTHTLFSPYINPAKSTALLAPCMLFISFPLKSSLFLQPVVARAQIPSRAGGPPAKRQPSPEGLGWNPPHDPSAIGAVPTLSFSDHSYLKHSIGFTFEASSLGWIPTHVEINTKGNPNPARSMCTELQTTVRSNGNRNPQPKVGLNTKERLG
jgi:hypothetical protein